MHLMFVELMQQLNAYQFYREWAYYGNYSSYHSAYIARVSDVIKAKDQKYLSVSEDEFCVYRGPKQDPPSDFYIPFEGHCHGRVPMKHDKNKRGTILHWAVIGGNYESVKFLLSEYGEFIDLEAKVKAYDITAYDIAVTNSYWDIAKLLKEKMVEKGTKS
eukprot:TRINITY_DN2227_c0_g1_i1.p1 TRINITY_DN2227_c0_g1~~TRINITY_DN2227_c0_g1_i1.p1  ORF type:complete len:160 (+),score=13.51 TRINITY_DN2227_c0_g1_i1:885-1364(+)